MATAVRHLHAWQSCQNNDLPSCLQTPYRRRSFKVVPTTQILTICRQRGLRARPICCFTIMETASAWALSIRNVFDTMEIASARALSIRDVRCIKYGEILGVKFSSSEFQLQSWSCAYT